MKPRVAILIPTIEGREHYFDRLMTELNKQKLEFPPNDILIFHLKDKKGEKSTGEKRNLLIDMALVAGCTHRAFFDDDDLPVNDNYFKLNMPGVYANFDCNSLVGIYTENGVTNPNKNIFIHSLKYKTWFEDEKHYYRNPNHLNFVSLEKTKHIRFEHIFEGEDGRWSEELAAQDVLKTEYEITEPFYHYLFRSKTVESF